MRVIGYIRVSTEEQATGGISLAAQGAKLEAYAQLYELELVEVVVDAGISAKTLDRPALRRVLAMLDKRRVEGLVIAKLDRLTRSVGDWQTLIDRYFCEKAGQQLFSVADSIDTRSASGRMVLNIICCISQWERETGAERTRDALRHKIHQGQRVGRVRYGYDLAEDGKTLIPNAHEQAVIVEMLTLREAGRTLREIAAALTARGVPTKDGGHQWAHSAIARIVGRHGKRPGASVAG